MPKHKTDLTPAHHPHDYEIMSNTGPIFIGTKKQCEDKLEEVKFHNPKYGDGCKIQKC